MPTECLRVDEDARLDLIVDWSSTLARRARHTASVFLVCNSEGPCVDIELG